MPLINIIILAQGEKSKIDLKQWSGRGERAFEGEDSFELHDFYDVGQYIHEHSKKRIKVYREEGFDIEYDYPATPTGTPKKK
jgi:superfamily II DNA or RNA helicase